MYALDIFTSAYESMLVYKIPGQPSNVEQTKSASIP